MLLQSLLLSLLCYSYTGAQESSSFLCYVEANCSLNNPRPVYSLGDSLTDCCQRPGIQSAQNHTDNTCFDCSDAAERLTPRAVALYPPQPLVLEVTATGYQYITWFVNGTTYGSSRLALDSNNMRLTLSDTVSSDVGEYEADVHLVNGTILILDFIVQAYVPPIILISSPTEDDIVLGHVNVTCTSQGNPPPTVSLYCDDLETNASYPDVLIDGDFGVVPAVVSTIGVQSDGADGLKRCHCRASAYDGNATFAAQDSVPLLPTPPNVKADTSTQSVMAPRYLELSCNAQGRPVPGITWFFNGNMITLEDTRRNISETVLGNTRYSNLTISSSSSSDHGLYICSAANVYGNQTRNISVDILFAPMVTASVSHYEINTNIQNEVTLSCVSVSNPLSELLWVGEGGLLNSVCSGGIREVVGEAGPDIGQIDIFHEFSGDLGVTSPNNVYPHNCSVNSTSTLQTFSITTSNLTLGSLLHEESMNFVCVGYNEIGNPLESTATIRLVLDGSPYFSEVPLAVPYLYTGNTVEYNCSVISVTPVNITWLLDGVVIDTGDEDIIESKIDAKTTSILTLDDIELSDAGRYTCHAENSNGTSTRSFVQSIQAPTVSVATVNNAVPEGTSILMTCTGNGNPLPVITWSFTDGLTGNTSTLSSPSYTINTITRPESYQVVSELTLTNLTLANAGRYTCTSLEHQSDNITIAVLVPAIITQPRNETILSLIIGNNATILCSATGVSAPNVSIVQLSSSSNNSVGSPMSVKQLDTGVMLSETRLVLSTVTSDAGGLYECQASNEISQIKHSFEVIVIGNTVINNDFQSFDIIREGNLTLTCNASTYDPLSSINWYHLGAPLEYTSRINADTSATLPLLDGRVTLVSTLVITDLRVSDGGNYMCEVVNRYGSLTRSVSQVNVQVSPSVTVSPLNLSYVQGVDTYFSCIGTGLPLPTLQFGGINCSPSNNELPALIEGNRFSGYCQTDGDRVIVNLTVTDITQLGPLRMTCIATNPAGDATTSEIVYITGPPFIITPPANTSVPDGGSFTLSCIAVGYPRPNIQWRFDDVLSDGVSENIINDFEIRSNLTVYNYTESMNEGEYYCEASNQYYDPVSSVATVATKYIAPSIVTSFTTSAVVIDSNVNITCVATGLPPPDVKWNKGGAPTLGNTLQSVVSIKTDGTPSVTTSTLGLVNINLDDEEEYTCVASSTQGSIEKIIKNLTVIVPPTASITPSSLVHVVPGQDSLLKCTGTGKPVPSLTINGHQCSYDDNNATPGDTVLNGVIIKCGKKELVDGIYNVSMDYLLTNNITDFTPYNVTCLAESSAFNEGALATAAIKKQAFQSVFTLPAPVTLSEGDTFNISCTGTGHPYPTLDWLYGDDNGAIVYNDRYIRGTDEFINAYTIRSVLTVKDLVPADGGEYKCRAQYLNGHLVHSTLLSVAAFNNCIPNPCVHGSCTDLLQDYTCSCVGNYTGKNCSIDIKSNTTYPPVVTKDPADVTETFLFGSFNLTCQASGTVLRYNWLKDERQIDETSAVLIISDTVPEDRGYYTCVAENDAGNSTSEPGLVLIPGLYQYVAEIDAINNQQVNNINNITVAMGECLSYDVLPDQNTTIIYSVSQCHYASCSTTNRLGSVLVTIFQTALPLASENLREYLLNKLQNLETKCALGVRVTNVWRFDGCRRESEVLHKDYNINITWPESDISDDVRQNCPCGRFTQSDVYISGTASRQCRGSYSEGGMWLESDTSQCNYNSKNISITLSLCHLTTVTDVNELVNGLAEQSREASSYEPLDFTIAAVLVEDLVQSEEIVSNREIQDGYVEALENLLMIDSNVVRASQSRHDSGDRLLRSIETFQNRIAIPNHQLTGLRTDAANDTAPMKSVTFQRDIVGLIVTEVNTSNFKNQTFTATLRSIGGGGGGASESRKLSGVSLQQGAVSTDSSTASVHIPDSLISKCPSNSSVRVNYIVFLSSVMFQANSSSFFGELIESGSLNVSSIVLSATACSGNSIEGLVDPIILEFPKPKYLQSNGANTSESKCVFWDPTIRTGSWSVEGCTIISSQDEDVVRCSCNHLTHFGYLFDVNPKETGPGPETTGVEVITYIGTIVSMLCLIITIITFCGSKKLLERTHGKTLINMCFALIGVYIMYLIAGYASSIRSVDGGDVICSLVGALLYYFMLVYFLWTSIEAIDLYRKLVVVFYNKTPWFIVIGCIVAWGVPLIIVGISAGAGHEYYMEYQFFCRPAGLPFYIGFLVPFGLTYAFNWVMFVIIIVKFCLKKAKNQSKEEKRFYINSKQLFIMAMILSVNFGLGWALGLVATADLPREFYLTFVYIFSLFVGMQGVLIFLLHCARSAVARNFWTYLFYTICLCKKSKEAKTVSGHKMPTGTPFATPGPRRKFRDPLQNVPLSSRGSMPGSPHVIIKNPVHGLGEADTGFTDLPQSNVFESLDLWQEIETGMANAAIDPKKKSLKEKKLSKKMSKKESKKKLSKKESKKKLSKEQSKKKLKKEEESKSLIKDTSKELRGSLYSLGEMSLTGSQALEIEFAPSIKGNSSSDEEEEKKWRKLSAQFESINAMVNESFIESKRETMKKTKESPIQETEEVDVAVIVTEEANAPQDIIIRVEDEEGEEDASIATQQDKEEEEETQHKGETVSTSEKDPEEEEEEEGKEGKEDETTAAEETEEIELPTKAETIEGEETEAAEKSEEEEEGKEGKEDETIAAEETEEMEVALIVSVERDGEIEEEGTGPEEQGNEEKEEIVPTLTKDEEDEDSGEEISVNDTT